MTNITCLHTQDNLTVFRRGDLVYVTNRNQHDERELDEQASKGLATVVCAASEYKGSLSSVALIRHDSDYVQLVNLRNLDTPPAEQNLDGRLTSNLFGRLRCPRISVIKTTRMCYARRVFIPDARSNSRGPTSRRARL